MATRFHIGAKQLQSGIAAYAKRFDLLEVRLAAIDAPAQGLATFRKWRKQVPPHFDFTVVVGPAAARLRAGKDLDADVVWAKEVADALQARCVLVPTPADVTPTALWRDRLAALAERLKREATNVVWEPSGIWEVPEAGRVARQLGLTLSADAAREALPPGPVAYTRLRALGETRSFGPAALERVVHNIGPRRDAFVIFETDGALAECKRLRQIASKKPGKGDGGLGRVVRPRTIQVKDDEQE
ncbi:hypothetical protein BH09MYX1_BH09MYX1_51930 [soil metagenome]